MLCRIAVLVAVAVTTTGCTADSPSDSSVADTTSVAPASSSVPAHATTSTSVVPPTTRPLREPASLVLLGGTVLTMDLDQPMASGVAIRGNQIVAVGSGDETSAYVGPETRVIDLAGRALLPGFVDAHVHYLQVPDAVGQDLIGIQDYILSVGTTTIGEMSVTQELLAEMLQLDSEGLVRVRTSLYLGHNSVCGEPLDPWILEVPPTRTWGERLRVGGVKVYTDGGACNVPASSYEKANGGNGDLYFNAEEIAELVSFYDKAGYQVALHALGDRAIEATLDGLEIVIGDSGNPRRHRIEHNTSVRPEMRGRYDEVGAVALTFGSFSTCFMLGRDDRFQFSMPAIYQEWEWPWRDLIDQNPNTVFAWHGDFPVFEDSSPLGNLAGYVTRRQILDDGTECEPEPYHLQHAITAAEALRMMTMGSAYALDRDTEIGSIETGKLADMVVLSADPTKVEPDALFDLSVDLTVLDGEIAFCGASMTELCGDAPPGGELAASSSLSTNPPEFAIDRSLETFWGSGNDAPQWLEIGLGGEVSIAGVRLVVGQYPAGFTRHVVLGRLSNGELVRLGEAVGETADLDVVEVLAGEPVTVVAVRVETVESPSWVSWFEVEVIPAG